MDSVKIVKPLKVPAGCQLALVTGASSGIGLEFCRTLAASGVNLVMVSNQPSELVKYATEIADAYAVKVTTLYIDLTGQEAAADIMAFLHAQSLRPDILINNAGIFSFNNLLDTPPTKIKAFIDLHIRTLTNLSLLMAGEMKERGRGMILNMSSMSCWMPMPGIAMYAATKAYIRVFSRSLACELQGSGVSVTVCCPGGIATNLFGLPPRLMRLAVTIKALQTPRQFTRKALKAMFRRRHQYINGMLNRFTIFLVGATPLKVRLLVKKKMLDKNITRP